MSESESLPKSANSTPGGQPAALSTARRAKARHRPIKRSEQVARQIVQDIVEQNLMPGEKLPQEPELLQQYDVSRSSLREALRLLEVQGLITVRPGPGSGTGVGRVDAANLANTLGLYLLMGRSSLDQLLDAWLKVEPLLAQLAAASKDRQRVSSLMDPFLVDENAVERELIKGLSFHDTVADLADNDVLSLILGAIGFLVTEQVRTGVPGFELSDATIHAHDRIAKRILDADETGAYEAMRSHIEEVIEEIRTVMPNGSRASLFFL